MSVVVRDENGLESSFTIDDIYVETPEWITDFVERSDFSFIDEFPFFTQDYFSLLDIAFAYFNAGVV